MEKKTSVFLGKAGKIYGPFEQQEYNKLFSEGNISKFTWIWDWSKAIWKPLEAPPPPLGDEGKATQTQVLAICYDQSHFIRGKIEWITETGCTLVSRLNQFGIPFPLGHRLELNLLDPLSKRCTSVPVTIANIQTEQEDWIVHLRWDEIPKLLELKAAR